MVKLLLNIFLFLISPIHACAVYSSLLIIWLFNIRETMGRKYMSIKIRQFLGLNFDHLHGFWGFISILSEQEMGFYRKPSRYFTLEWSVFMIRITNTISTEDIPTKAYLWFIQMKWRKWKFLFLLGSTDVTITAILVAFLREKSRNFVGTCVGHAGLFDERKSVKFHI